VGTLRFQEGFAGAFRPRTVAAFVDINTSPPPANQNLPGTPYSSESGFRNGSFPSDAVHGNLAAAGLADFGTRLRMQFTNIPAGVTISVDAVGPGSTTRFVTSETGAFSSSPGPTPANPLVSLAVSNGSATAVWEILVANPNVIESIDLGVYVTYSGGGGSGNVAVRGSLAPVSTQTAGSATDPLPRFVDTSTAINLFAFNTVSSCLSISASQIAMSFNFARGATAPASQSLAIQGGSRLVSTATVFPYTFSGGNWLSTGGTTSPLPGTVTVTANPAGVSQGNYSGVVIVGALGASASVIITVNLVIGNTSGGGTEELYVGAMTLANYGAISAIPLPAVTNQKFCNPVRLAPDMLAWAYVPNAAERRGDFSGSAAAALLIDPLTNSPFPGGVIPADRLADPYAWRISTTGPAPGEICLANPSTIPQFRSSYYVTGRNTAADRLAVGPNLVTVSYQIGGAFPPHQLVSVSNQGAAVDFLISPPSSNGPVDPNRWLNILPPAPCCTTPASLSLGIQPVGLRAGAYATVVTLTPLGAIGAPLPISIGLLVQTPPNWIVVDPPTLQVTYQPGSPLPKVAGQFNVTIQPGRSYSVIPRVISPSGGNWLGVSANAGSGPGPVGVLLTTGAASLAPGSYLAVIDIVAGVVPLLKSPLGIAQAEESAAVCGGGQNSDRVTVFLEIPQGQITTVPSLPRDDTGYPLVTASNAGGAMIQQPAPIQFKLISNAISSAPYDVKSIMRNPDPADIPPSGWLVVPPATGPLPMMVVPSLDTSAIGTLPACDYEGYISVSNPSAGGAIVKVALSVQPTQNSGSPPNVTKIMAQIANGGPMPGGWRTTIILVNSDQVNPAAFQLLFHPNQNISPDAPFNVMGPGQTGNRMYQGMIPKGGSVTLQTMGPGAPFWQGWAELTAPDSVGGTAIFAQIQNASTDSEGAVLLKLAAGSRFFLPFDNNSSTGAVTSMALVNTSSTQPANVTVTFHDQSGGVFGQSSVPLGVSGHDAFSLAARFPILADKRGLAEFISDGAALSGLGLRFNSTSFTSFEILTPQTVGLRQAIAHIADGGPGNGAWKTSIILVNLDKTQTNSVTVTFHNGQGTPDNQVLTLDNGATGTYRTILGPEGSATITTSGGVQLWQGWAEVESTTNLGGFAVFQQTLGATQIQGTVSFTPLGSGRFVMPFDNSGGGNTGLAVANTSDQEATVTADFRAPSGAEIPGVAAAQTTLPLAPAAHNSFSISDSQALVGGTALQGVGGILDFTSSTPGLIGIGLRFSSRHAFTSLPIILK
jgi:hypothetical protein